MPGLTSSRDRRIQRSSSSADPCQVPIRANIAPPSRAAPPDSAQRLEHLDRVIVEADPPVQAPGGLVLHEDPDTKSPNPATAPSSSATKTRPAVAAHRSMRLAR